MSDSISGFQTRGDLYQTYKQNNPVLAKAFLGKLYHNNVLCVLGAGCLVSALLVTILFLSVDGTTGGFGPASAAHGGIAGAIAAAGIVMLAIAHCKKRKILAEQLPNSQIEAIINQHSIPLKTLQNHS